MIETYTDIQETLQELGELLTFTTFTIWALPESEQLLLQQEGQFTVVESQEYSFRASSHDCLTNSIITGNTFIMKDDTYTYSFALAKPPVPSGDGWAKLPVYLTSKASL